jgi:hypothetical protein
MKYAVGMGSGVMIHIQSFIKIGFGLDDQGVRVRVPVGEKIFYFSMSFRPAMGPTGGLFPGAKLTTHLLLVPRTRIRGSIHPLPIHLHGVVLNLLSTGTLLFFYL